MTPAINYHGPVVAIDLDDTLYPELDYVDSAYKAIAQALQRRDGLNPADTLKTLWKAFKNGANPFDALIDTYGRNISRKDSFIPLCVEIYRFHTPSLTLPSQSRAFLETLRQKAIPLAIVTDGRATTQWAKIKALNLDQFLPHSMVWISQERGIGKLSDAPWSAIVRKYPEASNFIAIGDNPAKDFLYPNLLGFTTYMLKDNSPRVHDQKNIPSPAHAPSHIINSFDQVIL